MPLLNGDIYRMNNVCQTVVARHLCIGCGVCAGVCPSENLVMVDGPCFGYIPKDQGHCLEDCSMCLEVCPFENHKEDEDSLSSRLYAEVAGIEHRSETGYFLQSYAGYVVDNNHRWRSASGGVASWFLSELLKTDTVDYVVCVTKTGEAGKLFEFRIFEKQDDVLSTGKSAYYPVELSEAIRTIIQRPGRYALIGLPCFVKAVRLASLQNRKIRERLVVCAGLACGQLCSKGFTELLIRKEYLNPNLVTKVCYRGKKEGRPAIRYGVYFGDEAGNIHTFYDLKYFWRLWRISSLWACKFCDDFLAETADIVFMDAWLPEYMSESGGRNIVITRSAFADHILNENGISNHVLSMHPIPIDRVYESHGWGFREKKKRLGYRLGLNYESCKIKKRVDAKKPDFISRLGIHIENLAHRKSIEALHKQRNHGTPGLDVYNRNMAKYFMYIQALKILQKVNSLLRTFAQKAGAQ